ncbi:hypothetical protein D0Z00_000393 [Geotrichum galactomycetum]|uniref:Uncharacterized protein n=1 Tax=Geotrichum galactomycetum TaxID=27317 RepID=A0ACB6VA22_9ASCO|nr:hypothetical protein D0Z00_000393 [Geotrichum candidum]
MEEILAKAGSQAVTFAIRSGISIASGYAIKTLTTFLDKIPETERLALERSKYRLQTKIQIITPAIDLIELISARGNTSLASTFQLTQELKRDIARFDEKVGAAIDSGNTGTSKGRQAALHSVQQYVNDLLFRIEEAIPLISLALTTSGANLSARMPDSVSPGRFLQAGSYLSKADEAYENIASGETSVPIKVQVGPTFDLVMYTIFSGGVKTSSSSNSNSNKPNDVTWKEEFARCQVKIWRVNALGAQSCAGDTAAAIRAAEYYDNSTDAYQYIMTVRESFKDGRYHDRTEEKQKTRALDISSVTRLFFSASGRLLQIEESRSPVLVLKLNPALDPLRYLPSLLSSTDKRDEKDNDDSDTDDGLSDVERKSVDINRFGSDHVEWIAFEQYTIANSDNAYSSESELESESSESESEVDEPAPSERIASKLEQLDLSAPVPAPQPQSTTRTAVTKKQKHRTGELSLLEYIVRLAALQANDQESVANIHDERIALYLQDESGQGQQQRRRAINASGQRPATISEQEVDNNGDKSGRQKTSRQKQKQNRQSAPGVNNNSSKENLTSNESDPVADDQLHSRAPLTAWEQDRLDTKRQLLLLKRKKQ